MAQPNVVGRIASHGSRIVRNKNPGDSPGNNDNDNDYNNFDNGKCPMVNKYTWVFPLLRYMVVLTRHSGLKVYEIAQ